MSWREFWNADTPIYVNERHKAVHYRQIAEDIAALVPHRSARVLDYGCGEALSAGLVADACGRLYLCDSAPLVAQRLAARHGQLANVVVLAPEVIGDIPDVSLDLIVVNSVVQYLTAAERDAMLAEFRLKLAPAGRLLLADIIPPSVGPLTDASALLRLAAANGFLLAAGVGLVRTFFSDYRRKRAELGLAHYSEAEVREFLETAGYALERRVENLGHNRSRMAFLARVDGATGLGAAT